MDKSSIGIWACRRSLILALAAGSGAACTVSSELSGLSGGNSKAPDAAPPQGGSSNSGGLDSGKPESEDDGPNSPGSFGGRPDSGAAGGPPVSPGDAGNGGSSGSAGAPPGGSDAGGSAAGGSTGGSGAGGSGAGGSGGAPGSLPLEGLELWFRADQGAQLAGQDVSDGQPVTRWLDSGPRQNHANVFDVQDAPLFQQSGVNGQPVLTFGGAGFFELTKGATLGAVFVVLNSAPDSTEAAFRGVVGDSRPDGMGGGTGTALFYRPTATDVMFCADGAVSVNGAATDAFAPLDAHKIVECRFAAAVSMSAGGMLGNASLRDDRASPWAGDIAEIVAYDGSLDDNKSMLVRAYLAARYEIGTN